MSGLFPEREKAFENKWAHDEELRFRVVARRNKLLGLWAAAQMGLTGAKAEEYAQKVVQTELSKAGDEAAFEAVRDAFAAAGIVRTDHLIRLKMDEYEARATAELMYGD